MFFKRAGVIVPLAALLFCGCASNPVGYLKDIGDRSTNEGAASKELTEARKMVQQGQSSMAIPRFVQLISLYPQSSAAVEARYWLGASYQDVKSYQEAINLYQEYLRLAPEGSYAPQARDSVAALNAEYQKQFPSAEELDSQIRAASEKLKQQPGELKLQLELADLYWRRGDYQSAGPLYAQIVKAHPEFAQDETIAQRVEFQSNGEYTVLSPSELQRRDVAERPLTITNSTSYLGGKDRITREKRFYVVTGQAYNRSDSTLYGVQVVVTIYGFGNVVYDSSTVNIGKLNGGERRAFSIRFSNFETLENITRYECVGSFER